MSTELTTIDANQLKRLQAISGNTSTKGASNWPAKLGINKTATDDADRLLPMGHYTLKVGDKVAYAKTAKAIILARRVQYIHFDPIAKKLVGASMLESNSFTGEFLDTNGGRKCGKISAKNIDTLSKDEKDRNKQIKYRFYLFGILDLSTAFTLEEDGDKFKEVKLEGFAPFHFAFESKRAVEMQDVIKDLYGEADLFENYLVLNKPNKVKGTAFDWYEPSLALGDKTTLDETLIQSIEGIGTVLDVENERLYQLHLKAAENKQRGVSAEDTLDSLDFED